ncbi:MAG: DUF4097 family beta strand repeat protein [Oscillospiraceae bacterium]|nr:DUF4097 family beta strand repeat protein [Oscillospiraceae bacterium]
MKRFTKVCLVLGIVLLVAGAAAAGASYLLGVEQDIRAAMNPPELERREITIPGAELGRLEISLSSDDVLVEPSSDGNAHIRYPVSEECEYDFQTDKGMIGGMDKCVFRAEEKAARNGFHFDFSRISWPAVRIALPSEYAGELKIETVSGELAVRGITAGSSSFASTSGDMLLSELGISGRMDISCTSGEVTMENVQAASDCVVKTISGDIRVTGDTFSRYQASTTSGEIRVSEIASADWMHLQTISGDVTVRSSTVAELECKTISGDITVRDDDRIGQYQCATTSGDVTTDSP